MQFSIFETENTLLLNNYCFSNHKSRHLGFIEPGAGLLERKYIKKDKNITNNYTFIKKYLYLCTEKKDANMLDSYVNHLYLTFWTGDKKVGLHKEVYLSKRCETYGDMVYDIRWTLKYIHKNGKTSQSITIAERANKWDLRKVIHRIEKDTLPRKINELIEEHESRK